MNVSRLVFINGEINENKIGDYEQRHKKNFVFEELNKMNNKSKDKEVKEDETCDGGTKTVTNGSFRLVL